MSQTESIHSKKAQQERVQEGCCEIMTRVPGVEILYIALRNFEAIDPLFSSKLAQTDEYLWSTVARKLFRISPVNLLYAGKSFFLESSVTETLDVRQYSAVDRWHLDLLVSVASPLEHDIY